MALLSGLAPSAAENRAKVSPQQLAKAVDQAGQESVPYRSGKISPSDIRVVQCVGPDEEPTEFECTWRQRTSHGWVTRRTWLAIDGGAWMVIE